MVRLLLLLVLVGCGGKKKAADREPAGEGSVLAATAAQAVVERKGLLTLSEQVADVGAPERLKAIAPAVAVGQLVERRVTPTMIEMDLCADEPVDGVVAEVERAARRRPPGALAVRKNFGNDRCAADSQVLLTITMQIRRR
jgi:hypothetical protein